MRRMSARSAAVTVVALAGVGTASLAMVILQQVWDPQDERLGRVALVIDVDTAAAAQLALAPGISPAVAESIVRARTAGRGPRSFEELSAYEGVDAESLSLAQAYLRFPSGSMLRAGPTSEPAAGRASQ